MEKEIIILNNITKRFPVNNDNIFFDEQVKDGFFYALNDVSLSIKNKGCTIIAGANGSGKSLLMSIIAGLEEPTSGNVKTFAKAGLVFQEPDAQILGETVREDISFGPRNMALKKDEIILRVNAALKETGLEKRGDFPSRSLSGGEKRRLAVAGVLAMANHASNKLIIFDEPYANMDFPGIIQINTLIKKLKEECFTIIILTHELEKCMSIANRFIALYKGKKVFDGTAEEALMQNLEAWCIHHPLKETQRACLKTLSDYSAALKDLIW
ncbi:MAG: energy-coupling factor ABC transporter ATP-binding protein [Treponema sp.]|nr:energy-coupling factor ABC transporter ATP-binding protein [Treponema sp.]